MNNDLIEQLVIDILEDFFNQYGIKYTRHDSYHRWLGHYYNFRLKYIPPTPRKVFISKELGQQLLNHTSKNIIFDLINKAGTGKNLNPHQSKASFDASYHDRLFNDWGIHHLHISNTKKILSDYFVDRSNHLLFARFTNEEVYFLKSYLHKEKTLWSKRELIKIIRDNWPASIADKQMPGIAYPDFNDEEIFSLRKKGYLFGVNVDGQGYMMLGHGQASSGDNMMSGYLADRVVRWIGDNLSLFATNRQMFTHQLKQEMQLA